VAAQLLDGADVVAVLQKLGREEVPKGVCCGPLGNARHAARLAHCSLNRGLVEMMTATLFGVRIVEEPGACGLGRSGAQPSPRLPPDRPCVSQRGLEPTASGLPARPCDNAHR
jgi:hypothetical protein